MSGNQATFNLKSGLLNHETGPGHKISSLLLWHSLPSIQFLTVRPVQYQKEKGYQYMDLAFPSNLSNDVECTLSLPSKISILVIIEVNRFKS